MKDETTMNRAQGGELTPLHAIEMLQQGVKYLAAVLGMLEGVSGTVAAIQRLRRPDPLAAIVHRRGSTLGSVALIGAGVGVGLGLGVVLAKTVRHAA